MIELEKARHRLAELGLNQAAQSLDAVLEAAGRHQAHIFLFSMNCWKQKSKSVNAET